LLRQRIGRLGPVNMMAIEQFDELEARHTFLTTQRQDLIDSIAHFVAHWPQWPMSWVLLATVANVARALAAAVVVARLCDGIPRFVGIRTFGCFVVGAVIVAPSIGASIGAANVVLHGGSDHYWRPWLAWFTSNALTAFTMLPACIAGFVPATDL